MTENQGGLQFIALHQFLLSTVGVIWEEDHSTKNNNAEMLLLARQEVILTLNIDAVEEHVGETIMVYIYRVSKEEGTKLRESVPYVKIYRYNPKHLYPKLNGYGDNGQRSLKL